MRRFFRRIGSFRGFCRFSTALRQFFLSCAIQFTVPGIGVLEINEVLSLGLMPLSCIVIHTPANQVTILHLPRESSVFSVCSLVVRELFSMCLGYSTYWNSLAWMLLDSFHRPSVLFPIPNFRRFSPVLPRVLPGFSIHRPGTLELLVFRSFRCYSFICKFPFSCRQTFACGALRSYPAAVSCGLHNILKFSRTF